MTVSPSRPDLQPAPCPHFARRAAALVAGVSALAAACAKPAPPPPAPPAPAPVTRDLELDQFRRGEIHCAAGDCSDRWDLAVARRGLLRLEVYAPTGPGVPAFKLTLQDAAGKALRTAPPGRRNPRRLETTLAPGSYRVVVESAGKDQSPLGYDVVARLGDAPPERRPAEPTPTPKQGASAKKQEPSSAPEPPAPVARADGVLRAEVIDVEEIDPATGGGLFIWLDRGAPDGLQPGAKGRLVEGARTIGRIEVVEVFETGARAAVRGQTQGDITAETIAEIPLPGAR
jgi:hypothetical protein